MVKNRLQITCLVLLGCMGLAVALEVFLRARFTHIAEQKSKSAQIWSFAPDITRYTANGSRLIPDTHVEIRNHYLSKEDVPIDVNALGFRSQEFPRAKPASEKRILFLGDSITFADYLPEEATYVSLLENHLNNPERSTHIRLINAGVGGIGTKEELEILKEIGLSIQPDLVVLQVYLNDTRPSWAVGGMLGERGYLRRRSVLIDQLFRSIRVLTWLTRQREDPFAWRKEMGRFHWQKEKADFLALAHSARLDWGAGWYDEEGWTCFDDHLREFVALAKKKHFRFAIVVFPVAFQVYTEFLEDAPQQKVKYLTSKYQIPVLDLLPIFRQFQHEPLFYDQCHPNRTGNEIAAKAIAQFLAPGL